MWVKLSPVIYDKSLLVSSIIGPMVDRSIEEFLRDITIWRALVSKTILVRTLSFARIIPALAARASTYIAEKTLSTLRPLLSRTMTPTPPSVLSAFHAPSTLALSKPCGGRCQRYWAMDWVPMGFCFEFSLALRKS